MSERKWVVVAEETGQLQAQILSGLLEARGIPVWISQEGIGDVLGATVGSIGRVQVLVPDDRSYEALAILAEANDTSGEAETGEESSADAGQ